MKAIESDFLKVIRDRQSFLREGELNEDVSLATELAGRVQRFMEWIRTSSYKK